MSYFPYAQELGARYTLTGGGVSAVFNDQSSADYVGIVREVGGLDGAEVRESADDIVEGDGGRHGAFYFGRRPITFTVMVLNPASALDRATRLDKLRRVCTAGLRADISLSWIPTWGTTPDVNYVAMYTPVRLQQPLREQGNWQKTVSISLVSEFAPLFSNALRSSPSIASGASAVLENKGSFPAAPVFRVTGATTAQTVITNTTTGKVLKLVTGYVIPAGQLRVIDVVNQSMTDTGGVANYNDKIDWSASTWPTLASGNNTFSLTGGGSLVVEWRDTWA